MLQRGNDKKSPKHAAMPSHETIAHAKRCSFRSFNAAKFVAAYQISVHALATGMRSRSGNKFTSAKAIAANTKSA